MNSFNKMKFVNVKRKQLIHLILRLDFEQKTGLEYLQTNSSLPLMLSEKFLKKACEYVHF